MLGRLSVTDRPAAFRMLMDTVWCIDVVHRGRVVQAMVHRARALPDTARASAFSELRLAAMAMPPAVVLPLFETLTGAVEGMPCELRGHALQELLADVPHILGDRRPRLLWCMSREIGHLPDHARSGVFQGLLTAVRRLPHNPRSVPLVGLAWAVPELPASDRKLAIQELLRETLLLPAEHRRAPLSELASAMRSVLALDRYELFDRICESAASLPAHLSWEPLSSLARNISALEQPELRCDTLLTVVLGLPERNRGDCLEELAGQVGTLPLQHRRSLFKGIIRAVAALPPAMQTSPLQALLDRAVGSLPECCQEQAHLACKCLSERLPLAFQPRRFLDLAIG